MSAWEEDAGMAGDYLADLVEAGKLTDYEALAWIAGDKAVRFKVDQIDGGVPVSDYDPTLHVAGTWDDDQVELKRLGDENASQQRRIEALKWMYRKATGFSPTAQDYSDAFAALEDELEDVERDALAEHLAQVLATSDPLPPDGVDVQVAAKRLLERLGYEGDGR
jgi:hypothetical protein